MSSRNKMRIDLVIKNLQRTKVELPIVLAVKTQNYFVKTFTDGGWEGHKWKLPKRKIQGTKEYRYNKFRSKPTMVQSGILRSKVASSIRSQKWDNIRLVVESDCARRHNEGLDNMPQRKFMGDGPKLRQMQTEEIIKQINRIWQG